MLKQALAVLAIGMLASGAAASATNNPGIALSKDGHVTSTALPEKPNYTPPHFHSRKLKTIFSTFNTKYPKGYYWCCTGLTVSGSNAGFGDTFADAVQFSSATDAKITEIDAAVGFIKGTNSVVFGIYTDRGGMPDKPVGSFTVNDLVQWGLCCSIGVATGGKSIRIKAGKSYWMVVSTTAKDSDTWVSWSLDSIDEINGMLVTSTNAQGQWQPGNLIAPVPAFALYGK